MVPVQIHTLKPRDPLNTTHDADNVFHIRQNILLRLFASFFNWEGNEKSVSSQIFPIADYKPAFMEPDFSSVSSGTSISWITFS